MSDYGFHDQLRKSWEELLDRLGGEDRVRRVLHRLLDPIAGVRRGSEADDHAGVDFWADRSFGRSLGVDVKLRPKDHDDLLIEFVSNTTTGAPGWAVDPKKITDYVLYMAPSDEVLVSYPQLRAATNLHLPSWIDSYPENGNRTTTDNGSYRTRWIAVPDQVVARALGFRVTGMGRHVSTTAADGPRCPTCGSVPLLVEPSVFDPSVVTYRCAARHHWAGRAA